MDTQEQFTAFAGPENVVTGPLNEVAQAARTLIEASEPRPVLVFSNNTGAQLDIDLRGGPEAVVAQYSAKPALVAESAAPRKPGRPKLGVVGREVTLMPRHWEWLNVQPGGASVALRKLVEQARRGNKHLDRVRFAREATYRFISAMAGNEPGFEEACRALFAGNKDGFTEQSQAWPMDVCEFAQALALNAFED
ncbi:MAG: hypothetical protein ACI9UQ_000652 [Candidatus Krumholzibacteriia bacterium]|jgi:hypothetical protein